MKGSQKSRKWVRLVWGGLGIASLAAIAIPFFLNPFCRAWLDPDYRTQMLRYGESLVITKSTYYEPDRASYEQLTEQAISGMAKSLDTYSHYSTAESFEKEQSMEKLQYVGAGFQSRTFRGEKVVTRIFPKSPAEKAGLQPGDRVTQVDGQGTAEMSDQEFVESTQGVSGTELSLALMDPNGETRTVKLLRAQIRMNPVQNFWVDPQGNGYLQLTNFTPRAVPEMSKALKKMKAKGMHRLILDLRDNPGGEAATAVAVAGFFLPASTLVFSTESPLEGLTREYRSEAQEPSIEVPLAVLVNSHSASGSEALAGALQAHVRGIIVGETTYGKAVGQHTFPVSHGAGLTLTVVSLKLPDGTSIHGKGVIPDHEVACDADSLSLLQLQRCIPGIIDPEKFETLFGTPPVPDPQLQEAIKLLQAKPIDAGDATPSPKG